MTQDSPAFFAIIPHSARFGKGSALLYPALDDVVVPVDSRLAPHSVVGQDGGQNLLVGFLQRYLDLRRGIADDEVDPLSVHVGDGVHQLEEQVVVGRLHQQVVELPVVLNFLLDVRGLLVQQPFRFQLPRWRHDLVGGELTDALLQRSADGADLLLTGSVEQQHHPYHAGQAVGDAAGQVVPRPLLALDHPHVLHGAQRLSGGVAADAQRLRDGPLGGQAGANRQRPRPNLVGQVVDGLLVFSAVFTHDDAPSMPAAGISSFIIRVVFVLSI